jgi:hypothetical protein
VTARMKAADSPNSVKPMTGALLRALCAEAGVVRSGKEPSRAAYEELAQTINDFRRLVSLSTGRWEGVVRPHASPCERAAYSERCTTRHKRRLQ